MTDNAAVNRDKTTARVAGTLYIMATVASSLTVVLLTPMLAAPDSWWGAVLAFVLFRIFDIAKPWPIREIDHGMRGGAGIMLDDVLAGVFAALGLMLVGYVT